MRIRLRQIVMVAGDLDAVEREIVGSLGVELCYRDPGVGHFGLRNALFPIGDKLLEVVSPIRPGTAAGRFLDKRGGDGGYMVMFEVDDLARVRELVADAGMRVVFEAREEGIVGLHLHPADVGGAIVSIDETETWGEWPWAGPRWRQHVRAERVTDVLGVEIEAVDPAAMAARWARVLDRPVIRVVGAERSIDLDEGTITFVPSGQRGDGVAGFVLAGAAGAELIDVSIAGCRFATRSG